MLSGAFVLMNVVLAFQVSAFEVGAEDLGPPRVAGRALRAVLGRAIVYGSLDRAYIDAALRGSSGDMLACLARKTPARRAKRIRVVLGYDKARGLHTGLSAQVGLGDAAIDACLGAVVVEWEFPLPRCACGITLVDVPIRWRAPTRRRSRPGRELLVAWRPHGHDSVSSSP